MPERLRRLENLYADSPIYFVTACTHQRRALLATSSIHDAFRKFVDTGADFGAWVGSYILMPDHLHLFVAVDGHNLDVSAWMKSLKGTLSAELRREAHPPPHWQKGFFDHILRGSDSYSAKWHYVRDNAVRAGLVRNWEDWPYLGEPYRLEYRYEW